MTGDYPTCGDHPGSKPVYDVDSVQLIELVRKLDTGVDFAGNKLDGGTSFCAGAVSGIDPEKTMQLIKLQKKVKCGADFIQTQAVYDIGMFEEFMDAVNYLEVPVIAGLIPLKSLGMAEFMNKNISGIHVPEEIMLRMKDASSPMEEGLLIASKTIKELTKLSRGIHVMPIGSHRNTARLLSLAGISQK